MRIDYIANVRLPTERAHGLQIIHMCESFAKEGTYVRLIIPRKLHRAKGAKDLFRYYNIPQTFKLLQVPVIDLLGLTTRMGPVFYWIDLLSFLFVLIFVSKESGSIVYSRDPFLLAPFSREKHTLVVELHDLPKSRMFLRFLRRAHKIIVLTHLLKDDIVRLGIPTERILVAPDGVDLSRFSSGISTHIEHNKEDASLPQGKPIILYTGHLYAWKGATMLAQAAALVPEANVVFVGGIGEELAAFRKEYADKENITVIPFVPHSQIPYYLSRASVVVLPNSGKETISARYTSPLKLFEYMAAGKPIVASDLPSLREILNEDTAVLVTPDDAHALAEGIRRVLTDSNHSAQIALASQKKVKGFTWDARALTILSFLRV